MKFKRFREALIWLILVIMLSACGPSPLNDDELALHAGDVCETLFIETQDLEYVNSNSEPFRNAADSLAELDITEESAPNGYALRAGLFQLADAVDAFNNGLAEALTKADVSGYFSLFFTEEGSVFCVAGENFFTATHSKLDIDPALYKALKASQTKVNDAAAFLGLESCMIE